MCQQFLIRSCKKNYNIADSRANAGFAKKNKRRAPADSGDRGAVSAYTNGKIVRREEGLRKRRREEAEPARREDIEKAICARPMVENRARKGRAACGVAKPKAAAPEADRACRAE